MFWRTICFCVIVSSHPSTHAFKDAVAIVEDYVRIGQSHDPRYPMKDGRLCIRPCSLLTTIVLLGALIDGFRRDIHREQQHARTG